MTDTHAPNNRRTIAFVIDDLGYGGAQKQLSLLARHLPAPYAPVVVSLSEKTDPFAEILEAAGVPVDVLSRRGGADVGRLWRLARVLDERSADIVHGFLDAANTYAFMAARFGRRPVVLSLRNERLRVAGARARALSYMLRRAEGVLVNSRAGRSFLTETIGVAKTRVLYAPNWADPLFLEQARQRPRTGATLAFGSVARFHKQKQLDLLIEALPLVRGQLPGARLVLQGDGPERGALIDLAGRLGIADAVEFLPFGTDVAATLAGLRCFVLPSGYEGLPNAAIEALAMGVPLVANAVGDVPDLVEMGRTGRFIDGTGPEAVAAAVASCLEDAELQKICCTAGPDLIARNYSIEAGLRRVLPFYDSLIGD